MKIRITSDRHYRLPAILCGSLLLLLPVILEAQSMAKPVRILPPGCDSPGVTIRQSTVRDSVARIIVVTKLENRSGKKRHAELRTAIWDKREFITMDIRKFQLDTAGPDAVVQDLDFGMPGLWNGRYRPFLYRLVSELKVEGRVADRIVQAFGLRETGVDDSNNFILNGKSYTLHGVIFPETDSLMTNNSPDKTRIKAILASIARSGATVVKLPVSLRIDWVLAVCDTIGLFVPAQEAMVSGADPAQDSCFAGRNSNHPSLLMQPLSGIRYVPFDSVDVTKNPDRYFRYKAEWSGEPVIHILQEEKTFTTGKRISVICNWSEPVLEVNGQPLPPGSEGNTQMDFYWENIPLHSGVNKLKAIAKHRGKVIEETCEIFVK